ncbi:MAG: hypothetical protein WAZ98_12775 [Cyclobacteriaceae bacterium]
MKRIAPFLLLLTPFGLFGQSSYVSLNESYYHTIDRYEVKSGQIIPHLFTTVKPYKRLAVVSFLDSANQLGVFTSQADRFNLEYFQNDNWEWARPETNNSRKPFLKYFYKKKSDFLFVDKPPDFDLHVNPVLYAGIGKDSEADDYLFINTRGVELRGILDQKIGFYLYLADNQTRTPSYVTKTITDSADVGYYPVLPHEGFWKTFKDNMGYDFLHTRGYISFEATKHFNLTFGQDRFFIGNGQRSLIFSDHGPPSLFLKGNIKVWRLNYLFSLNRMVADARGSASGLRSGSKYPDKFVALHHLSINIGKKWNVGVFESVVFTDSTSFEWSYLNPIIFYRAIEQQFGSSDNVILGMDFKWNALKGVSLYGQFVLDEFVLDNIKEGNGWWANKFGIQAGVKYFDAFGVSNLDLQAETNIVRPYTYSHGNPVTKENGIPYGSYSGYLQPIAHPLGANFKEFIGVARYQPIPRLNLTGKLMLMQVGRDTTSFNWGGDILKSNSDKEQDFDNTIGQGVKNDILFASFTATWQVWHNVFIDASVVVRKSESPVPVFHNNTTVTSLALRWNIAQRLYEF